MEARGDFCIRAYMAWSRAPRTEPTSQGLSPTSLTWACEPTWGRPPPPGDRSAGAQQIPMSRCWEVPIQRQKPPALLTLSLGSIPLPCKIANSAQRVSISGHSLKLPGDKNKTKQLFPNLPDQAIRISVEVC